MSFRFLYWSSFSRQQLALTTHVINHHRKSLGVSRYNPHGRRSSETLEFMVAPWLASNELIELYTPLLANLSQTIEQPVRLNIAPDYPTLLRIA